MVPVFKLLYCLLWCFMHAPEALDIQDQYEGQQEYPLISSVQPPVPYQPRHFLE